MNNQTTQDEQPVPTRQVAGEGSRVERGGTDCAGEQFCKRCDGLQRTTSRAGRCTRCGGTGYEPK